MGIDINNLTIGQVKRITAMLAGTPPTTDYAGQIGDYVVVRCVAAGVHAGTLEWQNGGDVVLADSRRLWYWKPAEGRSWLGGVAEAGLHRESKVGPVTGKIRLPESCEVITCTTAAKACIQGMAERTQ